MMNHSPKNEKREANRRKESERRDDLNRRIRELDELYQQLVAKGVISDSRKGERRIRKRRGGERRGAKFGITAEERYAFYLVGINIKNRERKNAGKEPLPVLSFEEWSK